MKSSLPLSARRAYALAVLSGLLYFVAFPGVDVWPLSFVTFSPLIVALRGQSPRRALALGWTAGFTMTMTGFYWLLEMMRTFSGFNTALCLLFMAILCAYQAGRIGLMGWLYGRAESRGWWPGPSFALAFSTSELVFPLVFPWTFGATVHQVPVLTQVAELGNPIAVGLVLVAANWGFAEVALALLERRPLRGRMLAGCFAVVPLSATYGLIRIEQVERFIAEHPKKRVGLVQANMSLMGKREAPGESLRRHLRLTRELQRDAPLDLVVWSETSVGRAEREDLAYAGYQRRITGDLGTPALIGAVLLRPVADARKFVLFNTALMSNRAGEIVGRYDKQYLLAFGEYLPLGGLFPYLYELSPNTGHFTPGSTFDPLPLEDAWVSVHICYEDIIPAFINRMFGDQPVDLLVNMTNDAWFGDSTEPWIHLALAQFRAIEHRRFFVRSTNSGVSAFIDPLGRVVSHTQPFRSEALAEDIALLRPPRTPYEIFGDTPWWLGALASAFMAMGPARRQQINPIKSAV